MKPTPGLATDIGLKKAGWIHYLGILSRFMTLPSFLGGREVHSHQEVQGSPAGRENRIMKLKILKPLYYIISYLHCCSYDLQTLLVRHLLLSLPLHRLDPEGKQIEVSFFFHHVSHLYLSQWCSHTQHLLSNLSEYCKVLTRLL